MGMNWRTKKQQSFQSAGCGQMHVIKFMGTCEGCGRFVYSHGCDGLVSCGDVIQDSPDPRGVIPPRHCMNLYRAKEYGMVGRDVVACYDCAQDGDKYRSIIAAAQSTGTWTHWLDPIIAEQLANFKAAGVTEVMLSVACEYSEADEVRDAQR